MSLVSVMLLQRNVPHAAKYYSLIGFDVTVLTESWAELDAGSTKIFLKKQEGCVWQIPCRSFTIIVRHLTLPVFRALYCREAQLSTGYSPILNIEVTDLQFTIQKLLPHGAHMDGPIRFTSRGKVAAVRNPDGHMMSLHEPS